LTELDEERKMSYVTSIERMAEVRGKASVVLSIMAKVLGSVPD